MFNLMKFRKLAYQLSCGGICLSVVGAWGLVDFGSVFTSILSTFISLVLSLLFGQSLQDLLLRQTFAGG